jgi:hypothetical protein
VNLTTLLFLAANYTTYIGGTGPDIAAGMAVDYAGAVYVADTSSSTDFPVTSTKLGGPASGHSCGFISKLTPDGSAMEFSICIPDLIVNAFAMDPSGAMYIAVTNLDYSQSVLKLDRNAQTIAYTTPFQSNQINAITVDPYGVVYVAGTGSSLTTTQGAYQPQLAAGTCHTGAGVQMIPVPCLDAFVAKLALDGSLVYATYLGGSGPDSASAIAIDGYGNAWITGTTVSSDFPTTAHAFQKQFHGENDLGPLRFGDAFVAELEASGSTLLYSSYLGGSGPDGGNAIANDGLGSVYVVGTTQSLDFPITQPLILPGQAGIPPTSNNGFAFKLDANGNFVYSSFILGPATSVAVTAQRQALVSAGGTAYMLKSAEETCQSPTYGTLLASDGTNNVYSAGTTKLYSPSIASPGAFQTRFGGGDSDVVVQASDASLCFQAPTK